MYFYLFNSVFGILLLIYFIYDLAILFDQKKRENSYLLQKSSGSKIFGVNRPDGLKLKLKLKLFYLIKRNSQGAE